MKKLANLRGFVITGAAALFVGLAANVQAIPISIAGDLDTEMGSWIGRYAHQSEAAFSFGQSHRNESLAGPTAFALFAPREPLSRNPQSVPDGGMTAMMLGGVFCGFVLLAKKMKA